MTEGGRPLDDRVWLLTGALCCCLSAAVTLLAILTGISWIISQAGS